MNDFLKLYKKASPVIQIVGFVIVCGFIAGSYHNKYDAYQVMLGDHEMRLGALERGNTQVNQKLEDMLNYFGVPHRHE